MAMNSILTAARNAMCDALVDRIDLGAGANGTIDIIDSTGPTVLATLAFTAKATGAFGDAATGVATANAIADDSSADNDGTANQCEIKDCDGNVVWAGDVDTSGADINLNTTAITTGDVVSISSMTVTMPAS